MHPIICQIGPLTIYSYGVMLAVAVAVCTFLLQKEARHIGYKPELILDLVFWTVVSGIIGCRLFFIFLNARYYLENPSEVIMLQKGGLAWQGGLILGTVTAIVFIKKNHWKLLPTLDLIGPYIALGQAIGRLGCFLNGCCYGREVAWGIYFPAHEARLYPTQLFDSVGLLAIFFILKQLQKIKKNDGEIFLGYVALASFLRFNVEFFRADHTTLIFNLSIFQVVSLCIMTLATYVYFHIKSRSRK